MAERTILKARVESIEFAEPIKSESELNSPDIWKKQPLTLRDDEVSIVEAEPEAKEVYSHENDAPEDYDLIGGGLTITGSFINADYDEIAVLLGGEVTGTGDTAVFKRKAKKTPLNKAIRFTLRDGSTIVIPNAKGYVLLNLNAGSDGILKFPFSFKAMAQKDFDYDIIIR
jgi:hypothetical protein